MATSFADLGLHANLVQAVADRGYTTPTPIQTSLIPIMLEGRDVIGQAQTGTGKTAAFSLPLLHNLNVGRGTVQGLVLAPTRELALQVANAMEAYGEHLGARVLTVYGGQSYRPQLDGLRRGVDVVVGTPGRIMDLMDRGALVLSEVRTVVLDEADEMLSMGFIDDIETILSATPDDRQTALLSATMPREIRRLADRYLTDPAVSRMENKQRTVAAIEERYYLVNKDEKTAALTRLFEVEPMDSVLIFAQTRAGTTELANELTSRGFPADALNGDLSQTAREQVLYRFREGVVKVLVGTDVAARGLDIDDISHVFNYDLPRDPEIYVHRVGRTGRAGRTGTAISLVAPNEKRRLKRIEYYTKHQVKAGTLPSVQEIHAHRNQLLLDRMAVWLRRGRCQQERDMVAALVEEGHDPILVAAIALKMARAGEKQRPIAKITPVHETRRPKGKRGGKRHDSDRPSRDNRPCHEQDADMVRLVLDGGKEHGLRTNHVVSTIARFGEVPGRALGKIRIRDRQTYVDVPEQYVKQVLEKKGGYRFGKHSLAIARAN